MYWRFKKYVPVAKRRADAARFAQKLAKKEGRPLEPIRIEGRNIAHTFWGKAWCENLESYSDFENRLPRGRTYVRNGSVVDLHIQQGLIKAHVSGSEIYTVKIEIARLKPKVWKKITADCAASIDSLLDLLGGRFSDGVMQRLTRLGDGLFPQPSEVDIRCSCPDWAVLCKHAAAVLYGVGARLDHQPELLFRLRDVDHAELVNWAVRAENLDKALGGASASLAGEDLAELFDIELDGPDADSSRPTIGNGHAAVGAAAANGSGGAARSARSRSAKKKAASPRRQTATAAAAKSARNAAPAKVKRAAKSAAKPTAARAAAKKSAKKKTAAPSPARKKAVASPPARPRKPAKKK